MQEMNSLGQPGLHYNAYGNWSVKVMPFSLTSFHMRIFSQEFSSPNRVVCGTCICQIINHVGLVIQIVVYDIKENE